MSSRRRRAVALVALAVAIGVTLPAGAAAKPPFYGVVAQGGFSEGEYDLMGEANVGTLRLQLSWPTVQAGEGKCQASAEVGVCDWRIYDSIIGSAAARGVEVFPYLLNTPSFIANDAEKPPIHDKRAKQAWTGFVEAAVKRYGPGGAFWETAYPVQRPLADPVPIGHWQVWNEPSAAPFWHPKPDPRDYGKLVKITSKAITGVDEDAYIVLAGLFGTPTVGIVQPEFIRGVYKVPKIERFFDAVAIHPYGPDLDRVRFQVDWALDEMRRAGDRNAGLWISEIGWASDRLHNQLGVGRKGQAKMLTRSFEMFRRKRQEWNIVAVNWYAWQDTDESGYCDFCRRSGLVNVNDEPKPSYDAFREQAVR
jgi:hypothetical protein